MSNKTEIKKIVLDLDGTEIDLTMNQAKKLNKLLGELFNEPITLTPYQPPIIIEKRVPYWEYPYITWTSSDNITVSHSAESQSLNFSI